MSILTVSPNTEVFSKIPELHDVLVEFREKDALKLISEIGNIFVRHNMYNDFGLSMVHRHFDMSSEEILVETMRMDKTLSISVPWKVKDSLGLPSETKLLNQYGIPHDAMEKYVVPQNWCFTQDGTLEPFEYLATNSNDLPNPSPAFALELYEALKALGVVNVVGLRRSVHLRDSSTWEITPNGLRANVVVFGPQPEELKNKEMVPVFWHFDKNGKLRKDTDHDCDHCGSCTHVCGICW